MGNEVHALPRRSLIVLCGPAGAGKSTFASKIVQHNRLATTAVVSSDTCRLMLRDEISSVAAEEWATLQPNTFRLFLTVTSMRMEIGRPAIADGVNLHSELRIGLLGHARTHSYRSVLVVFDVPLEVCLAQNAQRAESRRLPEGQIRAQREYLDEIMHRLAEEGWNHIVSIQHPNHAATIVLQRFAGLLGALSKHGTHSLAIELLLHRIPNSPAKRCSIDYS